MFSFVVHVPASNYIFCTSHLNLVGSLIHHRSDPIDGQAVANVEFFSLSLDGQAVANVEFFSLSFFNYIYIYI